MIIRGKRLMPLLLAAAAALSFPSCSAEVGRFEVHNDKSSRSARQETTEETAATETTVTTTTEFVYRGNIYDTNYRLLTYGTYAYENEDQRLYGENCGYSFGNIISEASSGLDVALHDLLCTKNPTPVNDNNNVGESVRLTIDADKQTELCTYMANMGIAGSIVVMRTVGSIMA